MIPSLPFEITRDIIQLSLPRLGRANARDRYQSLLNYSLVDSLWRRIAQEELVKHLDVRNNGQAGNLEKAIERRTAAGLSTKVVSLRIDVGSRDTHVTIPDDVKQIFSKCKDAKKVWIKGSNLFSLLNILRSTWYSNLKSLHLEADYFNDPGLADYVFNFFFPTLTHLTLSRVSNGGFGFLSNVLLKPSIVPSLASIVLFNIGTINMPRLLIGSNIGAQLRQFSVYSYSTINIYDSITVSSMNALETFVIGSVTYLQFLTEIPSALSTIRICESRFEWYTYDLYKLQEWINLVDTQHQLRQIFFPLPLKDIAGGVEAPKKIEELTRDLFSFLDERGVALKLMKNFWNIHGDEVLELLSNLH